MTTEAAAKVYLNEHLATCAGKPVAVFNPHGKPLAELPTIYGFNNGGSDGFLHAVLIAEDGTELGGHCCSDEGYMPYDLGIIEGAREDRHEEFAKHYPDGYRMEFVKYAAVPTHTVLGLAIQRHEQKSKQLNVGNSI